MNSKVIIRLTREKNPIPKRGEVVIAAPLSLESEGNASLPPIPKDVQERYLERIRQVLAEISARNDNLDWWYLPVSELQPNMTSVLSSLELEAQLTELVRKLSNRERVSRYVLSVSNARSAKYLLEVNPGGCLTARLSDKIIWAVDRAKDLYRRFLNGLIWGGLHGVHLLFQDKNPQQLSGIETLFVSRLEADMEEPNQAVFKSEWQDRYLGEMVEEGRKAGSIAMLARCGGDLLKTGKFCSQYTRFPMRTVHQMVKLTDVARILARAFRLKLRGNKVSPLCGLIVRESRNHVRAVADCILVEVAMSKMLELTKPRQIICMQENSVWEHAIVRARRSKAPNSRLIGYFHCPVMPSAYRYHKWSEVSARPMFDSIIPLGDAMADAMCRLGNWRPLLRLGYGFRNPDIEKLLLSVAARPRRPFQIVVLLGGMFDNGVFLKWVDAARKGLPQTRLLIKGHPVYGSKLAVESAGIKIEPYGDIRDISSLSIMNALMEADCVVYKGTTVGISALAAGIPAIHVDHGGLQTDDALFDSSDLAVSVKNAVEFQSAILKIMDFDEVDRIKWSKRAKNYAAEYYDLSHERKTKVLIELFGETQAAQK